MEQIYGAGEAVWDHFSRVLGLTGDLLPVVSNPGLPISPNSKIKSLGKTPSTLNGQGQATGISAWTSQVSTPEQVVKWSRNDHLGICLQSRNVRAIDVDVPDELQAIEIEALIIETLGFVPPKRVRSTSSKFLMLLACGGDRPKQVVKTDKGIIEMLGSGQQCIVAGAHIERDGVSRSRYEWDGGLPSEIPVVSGAVLDNLIAVLRKEFGVAEAPEARVGSAVSRNVKLNQAIEADPLAQHLLSENWVKSTERDGTMHIRCAFEEFHSTGAGAESSTSYFPAHTNGWVNGHFSCLHAGCCDRTDADFKVAVGFEDDLFSDLDSESDEPLFENLLDAEGEVVDVEVKPKLRFEFVPASRFSAASSMSWFIKGILPKGGTAMTYGPSGSGKSFLVMDQSFAVARGVPWHGYKTKQGRVAFIAAEGAIGMRSRVRAYEIANGVSLGDSVVILADAPNLMQKADAADIVKGLRAAGKIDLLVIDTLAKTTAGGNDSSSLDMGIALDHCRLIEKATHAMPWLVHHSGLTAGRARGSTALKAACDSEMEVIREDKDPERGLVLGKLKEGADDSKPLMFGLDLVCVGFDTGEDGDAVISCVCDWGGL